MIKDLVKRTETRALLIWLFLAGAVWGFLNIGGDVLEGETSALDSRILLALRNPSNLADPIGPRTLEESLRDVTALGGFTFLTLLTVVATLALSFHGKRRQALIFAVTVIAAQVSTELLKQAYDRPRPALAPHGSYVYSQSFPSGHSAMAAATFLTLATVIASLEPRRATKVLAYVLAIVVMIMVGVSRVYLGVHWPSDVLAGWCLGAGWALLAWIALSRLTRPAPDRP
ncbi:MAG TPA: phosphatase PAP2 family protein [Phenylobacterium sp.]|nr:phosphatase PAP2 family protein [Phenylobacterium sp.]